MRYESTPRIEINLPKIRHNAKALKTLFGQKGIEVTGVVKGVAANLEIVGALIESGITSIADTKIVNIKKMRQAGVKAMLIFLRTPAMSEVRQVVEYADISMNSEIDVVRALSAEAVKQGKVHRIIIMVEMGDLREGVMPDDVPSFIREVQKLPGIEITGIGTNFACFGGVIPTEKKMREFSSLAISIQKQFSLQLKYVSGGNSANYGWLTKTKDVGAINHIRLGESIFLGRETVAGKLIPGLYPDAFSFIAEVVESKLKPSVPMGERGRNAFGQTLAFKDRGVIRRAIVGAGRQDILVDGLTPRLPVEILGSSSDHIILDTKGLHLKPGDEIAFSVDYGALLSAMTSPYVHKKCVHSDPKQQQTFLKKNLNIKTKFYVSSLSQAN
jgi:predicted amino acid racemase